MGCGKIKLKESHNLHNEQSAAHTHKHKHKDIISTECKHFIQKRCKSIYQEYSIGNIIGEGSFGSVRKATHRITHCVRAIKSIPKDTRTNLSKKNAQVYSELEVLKNLDHPNILKLYDYYEDQHHFHLVTEYVEGGELLKYIASHDTLSERTAAHFMLQLLRALNYCHKNNICHRDLKPANLVLDRPMYDAVLKVIDFGLASMYDPHSKLTQALGSAHYVAPEVIKGRYDLKCDIWSCGVIMYLLVSGRLPFQGRNNQEVLKRVNTGKYSMSFKEFRSVSVNAKYMIMAMLNYDPEARPSAEDLLEHQWIIQNIYENSPGSTLCKNSIVKLRSFSAKMKLQQAIMTYISSHVMKNRDQPHYLTDLFRKLDKDQDGKITRQDLRLEFLKLVSPEEADIEVQKIMLQAGCTGEFLEYTHFIAATTDKAKLITSTNLEAAFIMLDLDEDGEISARELKSVFNMELNESEDELLLHLNKAGKHKLDLERFKYIMLKLI